jgi:hypothetical protein
VVDAREHQRHSDHRRQRRLGHPLPAERPALPLRHRALNSGTLRAEIRTHADDDEKSATARVTATRIKLLSATRRGNDIKAILLIAAMAIEVLGTAVLGAEIYAAIATA